MTQDSVPVDLALQGGGAHGAFTWGVLDRLLEEPRLRIDGISGTSAGAMNAAVLIDGHAAGGAEGARAALEALLTGGQPLAHLRERFARPVPRIHAGALFASLGATAMLDLSDGLAGDARHIAAASGVRVMVDLSHVPKAQGIPGGPLPPAVFAAQGGEDYELLATLPAGVDPRPAFEGIGLMVTDVGEVAAGEGAVFRLEGREVSLAGYDHFA